MLSKFTCSKYSSHVNALEIVNAKKNKEKSYRWSVYFPIFLLSIAQPAITCSKLTIETLEQVVKYV